jgi:hypothetical protein
MFVQNATLHPRFSTRMRFDTPIRLQSPNPGRSLKLHKHALWSVLKIPTALCIAVVISANKGDEFVVQQTGSSAGRERSLLLHLVITHVPIPSRI